MLKKLWKSRAFCFAQSPFLIAWIADEQPSAQQMRQGSLRKGG